MATNKKKVDFDEERHVPVEEYEDLASRFIPGYDGLYSLTRAVLSGSLPEGLQILVIGAGGGKEIVELGDAFPNAAVVGVDPSEKMLAIARQKIELRTLQSRVSLVCGTIDDVDLRQFDAATALLVMHFLPDDGEKLRFLRAIRDRLKPGGKFVIADGCFDQINDPAEFEWVMNVYRAHAAIKGAPEETTAEAVRMISESVHAVPVEREVELLREAGFDEIRQFFQGAWFRAWIARRS